MIIPGFSRGISSPSLEGKVRPDHDHVGILVRIDGTHDPAHPEYEPGLFEWSEGNPTRWNEDYWHSCLKEVEYWLGQGKNVVLRLNGWKNADPNKAATQAGLYGEPGSSNRSPKEFCDKCLCNVLRDLQAFSPDRLMLEPFAEFGFYRNRTASRAKAWRAWADAINVMLPVIREYLPEHWVSASTYSFDGIGGYDGVFPMLIVPEAAENDDKVLFPCHFYAPRIFTDQSGHPGTFTWGMTKAAQLAAARFLPNASELTWMIANDSDNIAWSKKGIASLIAKYVEWCSKNGRTPYVGECGAFGEGIPPASRKRYTADLKGALAGISYCEFKL